MGQKTHPIGLPARHRQAVASRWFADQGHAGAAQGRRADPEVPARRGWATRRSPRSTSSGSPGKVTVTVHTGRPGVVIGKRGAEVDKLRDELAQLTGKEAAINVEEIKRPELDAQLVADNIAHQLHAAHLVPPRHEAGGAERHADGRPGHQGQVRRAAWAAPKSRGPRATTRAGCRCTRCGPTSTTPPHREDDLRHDRHQGLDLQG